MTRNGGSRNSYPALNDARSHRCRRCGPFYPTVRKIAALDRIHTAEQLARAVYHTLPGIYQMLPSPAGPGEPDLLDPRSGRR